MSSPLERLFLVSLVLLAVLCGLYGVLRSRSRKGRQRKLATKALRESEARYRSAFEHAPAGMALVDLSGRCTGANHELCAMLGYTAKELTGTPFQALGHPDDLAADGDPFGRFLAGDLLTLRADKRFLHKSGATVWGALSVSAVTGPENRPLFFIAQIDKISARPDDGRLLYLAAHDPLTGLYNRERFSEEVNQFVTHARRYRRPAALFCLELDDYLEFNLLHGSLAGDDLLRNAGRILGAELRATDVIGRIGVHQFGVLLPYVNASQAEQTAAQVMHRVRGHVITIAGVALQLTFSLGIAMIPQHGTESAALLDRSHAAMLRARTSGGNQIQLYTAGMA